MIVSVFLCPFSRDLQVIFHGGSQSFQGSTGEMIPYKKIFVHPNFTVTSPKNDLMLIKLSVPLTFFSTDTLHLPAPPNNRVKDCVIHTWLQTTDFFGKWLSKRRVSCVLGYIHILRISEELGEGLGNYRPGARLLSTGVKLKWSNSIGSVKWKGDLL